MYLCTEKQSTLGSIHSEYRISAGTVLVATLYYLYYFLPSKWRHSACRQASHHVNVFLNGWRSCCWEVFEIPRRIFSLFPSVVCTVLTSSVFSAPRAPRHVKLEGFKSDYCVDHWLVIWTRVIDGLYVWDVAPSCTEWSSFLRASVLR
jgi:hypothetical protein